MAILTAYCLVTILAWFLTGFIRRYAISHSVMDIPNKRSSHSVATPRGGGVSIIIVFLFGIGLMWGYDLLGDKPFIAFLAAGLCVAIIGFMDDHGHIAARWRLLAHFCAASWLVFWLGGLPPLLLFGLELDLGWTGNLLAVIALVWLLNLYNFMDGIDGIAGIEALSSSLVVGLLMLLVIGRWEVAYVHILMAAAVAGFLIWNFPPAKIFMGDAGSGFIGIMLGALGLYSSHIAPQFLWVWIIMLGVFIVDSTYTLFRRLLRGDKVYVAHRSHAYQYASRKYGSHLSVTFVVLIINLFWLAPWSLAVATRSIDGSIALIFAYIPLLFLAWYFHGGDLEKPTEN